MLMAAMSGFSWDSFCSTTCNKQKFIHILFQFLLSHLLNNPVKEKPVLRGGTIVKREEEAVVEEGEEVGHGRRVVQL